MKKTANIKGSILIWCVMLGFLLTSVFFFFAFGQRKNIEEQRKTVDILNARMYLESLADYFQKYPGEKNTTYDNVRTVLTQNVQSIEGVADVGIEGAAEYQFSGPIFVEWNRCASNLKGDLVVNGVVYKHDAGDECDITGEYDDVAGPISVTSPFKIETLNRPFFFRINGDNLKDNEWHLTLTTDIGYGKEIRVERTF
ncbi:hypothetical protein JW752_00010 [Candidatus Peregrinibacteria bacterium]|nr:hypothetical protein [Candidatus Peregrinibacteria bacterium]